jgi:exodeoxyribonuclease VII small subunit
MISSGRAQARITQSTLDGSIDSPLCRARMAAESQRIAEQLAVLEQEGTRPDLIVELRSTLLSVRAQLCGASWADHPPACDTDCAARIAPCRAVITLRSWSLRGRRGVPTKNPDKTPGLDSDDANTGAGQPAPKFEAALEELEALVERMESGGLSLDDALAAFERGIHLTRDCQKALAQAEQRVRVLVEREDGSLATEAGNPEDGETNW